MQQEALSQSQAVADAVARAADEARRLGHRRVGSEHLLLGVLAEPAGAGKAVLEALRLEWAAVRTEIQELMPGSGRPIEGDLPLTDSAAGVLAMPDTLSVARLPGVAVALRVAILLPVGAEAAKVTVKVHVA